MMKVKGKGTENQAKGYAILFKGCGCFPDSADASASALDPGSCIAEQ